MITCLVFDYSQFKVMRWRHNRLGQHINTRLWQRIGIDGHLYALLPLLLPLIGYNQILVVGQRL